MSDAEFETIAADDPRIRDLPRPDKACDGALCQCVIEAAEWFGAILSLQEDGPTRILVYGPHARAVGLRMVKLLAADMEE